MNKKENKESKGEKEVTLTRERTVFANERTFNSWIRTGITATIGGLFIARFLGSGQKDPIITIIGFIFVLASVWYFSLGYLDYKKNLESIHGKGKELSISKKVTLNISILLIVGSVLSLVLIILFYIF